MNNDIYNSIVDCMEQMGYVVFEKDELDFNIGDYITDSINFIEFIVKLEEIWNVELPDDFLSYDVLFSAKVFAEKLAYFLENKKGVTADSVSNILLTTKEEVN